MQWQKTLLALTVMLFGASAVALPAHANNIIWVKSTSGTDSAAEATLLANLSEKDVGVATGVNIDNGKLVELAYKKAVNEFKCFDGIKELSDPTFNAAFAAEWKTRFRAKYQLTASTISWSAFLKIGRDSRGFEVCNQADNALLVQNIQNQASMKALTAKAEQIASQPMSPEDSAARAALMISIKKLESDIAGNGKVLEDHSNRIAAAEQQLKDFIARTAKTEAILADVVPRLAAVEKSATDNKLVLDGLASLPGQVAEVKKTSEANSRAINGVPDGEVGLIGVIAKLQEAVSSNSNWTFGVLALFVVIVLLVVARIIWPPNREQKPSKMAMGGQMPSGGKSAQSALEPTPQSDQAKT